MPRLDSKMWTTQHQLSVAVEEGDKCVVANLERIALRAQLLVF